MAVYSLVVKEQLQVEATVLSFTMTLLLVTSQTLHLLYVAFTECQRTTIFFWGP